MPASPKRGKYYDLNSDFKELYRTYEQQKHKFITINDSDFLENFESARTSLEELLLKMYPQKSSFENG